MYLSVPAVCREIQVNAQRQQDARQHENKQRTTTTTTANPKSKLRQVHASEQSLLLETMSGVEIGRTAKITQLREDAVTYLEELLADKLEEVAMM